jgi:hypothetical protein
MVGFRNSKMKNLNSKIIFFSLDNATFHPYIKLTNIQLSFLPPNTSSVPQRLDLGVIKAFKVPQEIIAAYTGQLG